MMPLNTQYLVVTVKQPVMFPQTADETWALNPNRRYIINANRLGMVEQFVDTVSELDGASLVTRLTSGKNIHKAKILVERNRERGIGDLLFMSGPLSYMHHVSGSTAEIDLMAYSDRGLVLTHSPFLANGCVKCGPLEYDHLRMYNYHWLVNTVTEQDSEPDQDNVYDALYRQLGFDPSNIEDRWKRPCATMAPDDYQNLDRLFRHIAEVRRVDLRRIGYIVVAPFANATLRCLNYGRWLEIIDTLSKRRPVVVVGNSSLRLPDMDMGAGEFNAKVGSMGGGVINAVDSTSLRVLMALISRAFLTIAMDSAPLYISQAVRTPAVSLWGTHAPGSRIGYDKAYMDLAVWKQDACHASPCFAFGGFPVDKCPNGIRQSCCEVLADISVDDVLKKVDLAEGVSAGTA